MVVVFVLAIVFGAPGCEVGVWPQLIASARGESPPAASAPACIIGPHLLDEWEAR